MQISKAMPCDCTSAGLILAKSAGSKEKAIGLQRILPITGANFQNQLYGSGMRLHNTRIVKSKEVGHTCTVCGKKKSA